MFGFSRKQQPGVVTATLNARLQPKHRADIEDAFDAAMKNHGYDARVVGGGTALTPQGEVSACDIEIELDDVSDAMIEAVTGVLAAILAPKGSYLTTHGDKVRRIDFGVQEGLALYLNGTDLPDDVYRDCDANHVFDECVRLLGDAGNVDSHWTGPQETALYMYGADFQTMKDRLLPLLQTYPLCRKCRIEQIA